MKKQKSSVTISGWNFWTLNLMNQPKLLGQRIGYITIKLWGLVYKTVNGPLHPFNGLNYLCFDYRLNFRSYQESKEIGQWTINLSKHMQLNNNKSFFCRLHFFSRKVKTLLVCTTQKNIQVFKPTNNRLVIGTNIISSPMTPPSFVYTKR